MSPRVLLVDDHPAVRKAVRTLLEGDGLEVVGEAWGGAEAVRMARDHRADVVVLDFIRPFSGCLDVAREIVQNVALKGVILLAFEDYLVTRAIQAGVRGYVLKARLAEDLPLAIRAVAGGRIYLSPGIPAAVVERCRTVAKDLSPTD